uniref:Uncharacterized protein n=1 Tax=Rhizophora mucronata TaxID=61149 RepID=A0A2P2NQH9_RHIMU
MYISWRINYAEFQWLALENPLSWSQGSLE